MVFFKAATSGGRSFKKNVGVVNSPDEIPDKAAGRRAHVSFLLDKIGSTFIYRYPALTSTRTEYFEWIQNCNVMTDGLLSQFFAPCSECAFYVLQNPRSETRITSPWRDDVSGTSHEDYSFENIL